MGAACIAVLLSVIAGQVFCACRIRMAWIALPGRPQETGDRLGRLIEAMLDVRDTVRAEPVRRAVRNAREILFWMIAGTVVTWLSVPLMLICLLAVD